MRSACIVDATFFRIVQLICLAAAVLVPLDYGKVVVRQIGRSRAAVKHEENWVASIASAHSHPLANTANLDRFCFIDSVRGNNLADFGKDRVRIGWRLSVCEYGR